MKSSAHMLILLKVIYKRVSIVFLYLWGMQQSLEKQFEESRLSSVIGIPWQLPNNCSYDPVTCLLRINIKQRFEARFEV